MAISTGDFLRGTIRWLDAWGNDYENVMHFKVVSRGYGSDIDFLTDCSTYWVTNFNEYHGDFNTGYVSQDCRWEKVAWVGGAEVVLEAYPVIDIYALCGGTDSNDSLPPNNAPCLTFRTAGVRTLPKQYLMPPAEDKFSNAGFASTTLIHLATFGAWFLADVVMGGTSSGTIRAVVHSKRAADWVSFIGVTIEKYLSHQNRRKTGVGS